MAMHSSPCCGCSAAAARSPFPGQARAACLSLSMKLSERQRDKVAPVPVPVGAWLWNPSEEGASCKCLEASPCGEQSHSQEGERARETGGWMEVTGRRITRIPAPHQAGFALCACVCVSLSERARPETPFTASIAFLLAGSRIVIALDTSHPPQFFPALIVDIPLCVT